MATCAICLAADDGEHVIKTTCGHEFHLSCLLLHAAYIYTDRGQDAPCVPCPMCRGTLVTLKKKHVDNSSRGRNENDNVDEVIVTIPPGESTTIGTTGNTDNDRCRYNCGCMAPIIFGIFIIVVAIIVIVISMNNV